MNKSGFITYIISKFQQLSVEKVKEGINQLLEYMSESLSKGTRIEICGFGSFSLRHHPARAALNPHTGKRLIALPKYIPRFKLGNQMRDRVNKALLKKVCIIHSNKQN